MATLRWTNLFTLLDSNKCGTIGPADATAGTKIIGAGGAFTPTQLSEMEQSYASLIKGIISLGPNTNGKVTLEQWLECGLSMLGKTFDTSPDWWKSSFSAIFKTIDADKKGYITEEEFTSYITGVVPVSSSLGRALYQQLQGTFDEANMQESIWRWITATEAVPSDIILTLAVTRYAM